MAQVTQKSAKSSTATPKTAKGSSESSYLKHQLLLTLRQPLRTLWSPKNSEAELPAGNAGISRDSMVDRFMFALSTRHLIYFCNQQVHSSAKSGYCYSKKTSLKQALTMGLIFNTWRGCINTTSLCTLNQVNSGKAHVVNPEPSQRRYYAW